MMLERPPIRQRAISLSRGVANRDRLTGNGANTSEGETSGNCAGMNSGIRRDLVLNPSVEIDASDSCFPSLGRRYEYGKYDGSNHTPEGTSQKCPLDSSYGCE